MDETFDSEDSSSSLQQQLSSDAQRVAVHNSVSDSESKRCRTVQEIWSEIIQADRAIMDQTEKKRMASEKKSKLQEELECKIQDNLPLQMAKDLTKRVSNLEEEAKDNLDEWINMLEQDIKEGNKRNDELEQSLKPTRAQNTPLSGDAGTEDSFLGFLLERMQSPEMGPGGGSGGGGNHTPTVTYSRFKFPTQDFQTAFTALFRASMSIPLTVPLMMSELVSTSILVLVQLSSRRALAHRNHGNSTRGATSSDSDPAK
ncbi:hypothetical protein QBC44DRAFT_311347 [Cladorrhinum sp. PSN332]|nr:hypothetical protein QBC44DRAFT_311347 [Cladorrhinum sp. PSN332]